MAKFSSMTGVVRFGLAASASAMALSLAAPAFAQDATEDAPESGREIVVTAQFREQKLQDTPLSITAVDSQLLESRNQTDISKIAAQAPNVTLNAMGGGDVKLIAALALWFPAIAFLQLLMEIGRAHV